MYTLESLKPQTTTLETTENVKKNIHEIHFLYARNAFFYRTRVQKSGHAQGTCPTRARSCPDFWTRKFSCPTRIRAVFVSDTQNTGHGGI